jgi:hypothetical protein
MLEISSQGSIKNDILPQILSRVNDIAEQMRKGDASIVSCFTVYDDDNTTFWRELRRDLIRSGFRSEDISKYAAAIKTYLRRL